MQAQEKLTSLMESSRNERRHALNTRALSKPPTTVFLRVLLLTTLLLAGCLKAAVSDKATRPQVIIQTELGAITVELDQQKAPVTATNFLR